MKGYVYILTNPSMPGLVKIGRTARCVIGRAAELYQTGVPTPFEVHHFLKTPDCVELERSIHEEMSAFRVSGSREFFKCEVNEATRILECCHADQIDEWVSEFMPDHVVVQSELALDEGDMLLAAHELGVGFPDVCAAIHMCLPEDLLPALARWNDRREKMKAKREADARVVPLHG